MDDFWRYKSFQEAFAQRIRVAYALCGETRKTIRQKTGIAETYLSFYANGRAFPDDATLDRLCKVLGCTRAWLLAGKKLTFEDLGG